MGYAHIKGHAERNGSSVSNPLEAEAIVAWIEKNRQQILEACAEMHKKPEQSESDVELTLADCIGIVTPFKAQANIIQTQLAQRDLEIGRVGTVHALQGAEKPIIIFSSVYSSDDAQQRGYFFDRSANMLNVAVSRAQCAFLVFGDMGIFDHGNGNQPSALLADYLFRSEHNEITDIIQPKFNAIANESEIEQITTLERHRKILCSAFPKSIEELNIVSPFLSKNALEEDNILQLVRENSDKKAITIYTDIGLNRKYRQEFNQAVVMLRECGAKVVLVRNVHSKIITIDQRVIIEGSFNWLSAARRHQDYIRIENSILYMGTKVQQFIEEAIEPIKRKAVKISTQY
ncbi:MAG: hypothetical protein GY821_14825 [Gammaproteobacteria bacterium]|nr:hypothetical protein [Gammaproteobacteria bacterium]